MPKVTAPLLSFGASGQIGNAQVYSTWRGIAYARRYVIPANPRTNDQVTRRNLFSLLAGIWTYAPSEMIDPFDAFARGKPLTGRNKFTSVNLLAMGAIPVETDLTKMRFSTAANGGLPASGLTLTPGAGLASIAQELPSVPSGWTLDYAAALAVENQNTQDPFAGFITSTTEDTTPESFDLTGLTNGTEYVVGVYLKWTKPDGRDAYSVDLTGTVTPAA